MIASKGIVHKDMEICEISKMGIWRVYLDSKLSAKMRNKVSSITSVKQSYVSTKRKHDQ